MIPRPAKPASSANPPSPITMIPADLKKSGACLDCANEADPKERRANIGRVPRAKKSIISIPEINDPLDNAETCIDCVNPHGRKNVPTPNKSGANVWCSTLRK